MNSLIKITAFFLCLGIVSSAEAQNNWNNQHLAYLQEDHSTGNSEVKEHRLSMTSGTLNIVDLNELRVEGYDGNEVIISTLVEVSERNARAAGLKLVNSLGLEDNTGFGVSVVKEGSEATVRQLSGNCSCNEVTIKVPKGIGISISHRTHEAENIVVQNVTSELEVSTNFHNVKLIDVTGPMAVKTVHGSIDAKFNSLSQDGSISLYAAHDFVDVTIPTDAKVNVKVQAPFGDVYSNADINITNSASHNSNSCASGSSISGTINGGGVEFSIKSAHDDVYLRQGAGK